MNLDSIIHKSMLSLLYAFKVEILRFSFFNKQDLTAIIICFFLLLVFVLYNSFSRFLAYNHLISSNRNSEEIIKYIITTK